MTKPRASWAVQNKNIKANFIFKMFLSTPTHVKKNNQIHGYDIHDALYLNCEIQGPWVRSSGPSARRLWSNSENVSNLLLHSHIVFKKMNAWL